MAGRPNGGFLLYNLKLMRTICLWPLESKSAKVLYLNTIYTAFIIVSHALVTIGQTIEIFISPNISSMASVVDLATLTGSALFKMVYIIWYREDFQKIVDKIDSSFVESDSPADTVRMTEWLKNYKIIINVYVAMAFIALAPVGITPYLSSNYSFLDNFLVIKGMQPEVVENKGFSTSLPPARYSPRELSPNMTLIGIVNPDFEEKLIDSKPLKSRKFPLNCWIPVDLTWSPMYEIVYLMELVPTLGSGYIYIVSDSFFFMVIYLVCGQLEILKASLRSLHDKHKRLTALGEAQDLTDMNHPDQKSANALRKVYSKEKEVQRQMDEAIIKCIDFHNDILAVIHDLDLLLRSMIIVDFLHAVISLSFAMLQTIMSNSMYEWFQMILFISVSILHQFLNNFFCEILIQQQMSVAEAAYDTPWLTGSRTFQSAVAMMIRQARHFTRLSGWKMYQMGLGTFVEFMKLLGSYFLVLQSLHADETTTLKGK